MTKKLLTILLVLIGVILLSLAQYFFITTYLCTSGTTFVPKKSLKQDTQALMLLIELENTEGLINFVDNIAQRDIPGLLLVGASYVEQNCEVLNTLLEYHDIEIAGVDGSMAYWDVEYDMQSANIKEVKEQIFECTGREIRVFGSRYFAYDENTVKAAQEHGIEYVLARGTTGAKATIYKPDEYNVKIFSVSNVEAHNWGTGSLCDYSYWAREGTPADFEDELFKALQYDKISPVTHSYIGGMKKSWNDVYLKFFDSAKVEWLDLDTFGQVDEYLAFSEIPTNKEVQYQTPHPLIPLEDEMDIDNPCSVEDITEKLSGSSPSSIENDTLVIFHNNTGSMCTDALAFFEQNNIEYIQYLNTDSNFTETFNTYKSNFTESEGISKTFGYYPFIFVGDKAFSGFNSEIQLQIVELLNK